MHSVVRRIDPHFIQVFLHDGIGCDSRGHPGDGSSFDKESYVNSADIISFAKVSHIHWIGLTIGYCVAANSDSKGLPGRKGFHFDDAENIREPQEVSNPKRSLGQTIIEGRRG